MSQSFLSIYSFNIVYMIVWQFLVNIGLKSRKSILSSYFYIIWAFCLFNILPCLCFSCLLFLFIVFRKFRKRSKLVCICLLVLTLCFWTFFVVIFGRILILIFELCQKHLIRDHNRGFVMPHFELTSSSNFTPPMFWDFMGRNDFLIS